MQAAAAPVQDFTITTGSRSQPATAYIFYPMNLIAPALKASVAEWAPGGLLRHEMATLRYRNGYIRQCEITECRQHMVGTAARNVYPTERRHMVNAYDLTENGVTTRIGGGTDDEPLLFTPWYPDQELGPVLAQNDGLVRMPISSSSEMRDAQYFLFPEWDDYVSGKKVLPEKLAGIREVLLGRQFAAPAGSVLQAVATAAVRACDLADAFGKAHVARENAMYQEAQTRGWAWSYGIESELYMEQLGLTRRDNLAQEQTNKIDRLADVLAEAFSRQIPIPPAIQEMVNEVVPVEAAPPVAEVPVPVEPVKAAGPDVGSIVRYQGKVAQITAMNKQSVMIETPQGEVFKVKPSEIEFEG